MPFLLETKTLLECVYTIGSVYSKSLIGYGLGQVETVSSKKPHIGLDWSSRLDSSHS